MIASFRRQSKSKVGTAILVGVGLVIAASFVFADLSGFGLGSSASQGGTTVVKVGGAKLTDRDVSSELQRRLDMMRRENPAATMADLAPMFDQLVDTMIDQV